MENGPQDYALSSGQESVSKDNSSDIDAMKERMRKRLQNIRDEDNEESIFNNAMLTRKFNERN